jgi:hypothetical protein
LGQGLKETSSLEPVVYWGKDSVKILKLTQNILHVELNINGKVITKKLPISYDNYVYLTRCLSRFNLS